MDRMIFTQRYHRALADKRLVVNIPESARLKLVTCLRKYDVSFHIRRDPNDNWISNSSIAEESLLELMSEHGWNRIPDTNAIEEGNYWEAFQFLLRCGEGHLIFDLVELAMNQMDETDRENCRVKLNQIFDQHECAWRIADGEFFKLDVDFMGARLAANAHDALAANRFVGAADEYAKARQELGAGDVKDGIFHAAKSFESVMKVMTGAQSAGADKLIQALLSQGYFDDLPKDIRGGFSEQVMKTLPFIRNKLAGHGQGAEIIGVPVVYGELAVQLAAVFHNFLISKHLERKPSLTAQTSSKLSGTDDEIPF
jgi:hypothetical protein